jgi:hypothetical protein
MSALLRPSNVERKASSFYNYPLVTDKTKSLYRLLWRKDSEKKAMVATAVFFALNTGSAHTLR